MSGEETFGRHDTLSNTKIRHFLKKTVCWLLESVLILGRIDWAVGGQVLVSACKIHVNSGLSNNLALPEANIITNLNI